VVLPDFDCSDVADGELTDKPLWSRPQSKAVARIARSKVEGQLSTLVDIREEVKQHGYVSEDSQERLESTVGEGDSLPSLCQTFSRLAQYYQSEEGAKDDPVAADTYKNMLLGWIGEYMSTLQDFLFNLSQAEDREHEANIFAHNLPANVDKLVRYETMLERKKEKAINLLMKLQAKG
jgi:hypothetical protein